MHIFQCEVHSYRYNASLNLCTWKVLAMLECIYLYNVAEHLRDEVLFARLTDFHFGSSVNKREIESVFLWNPESLELLTPFKNNKSVLDMEAVVFGKIADMSR